MPFGACTVMIAAVITPIRTAAANGVKRPRAISAPPRNSAVPAARTWSQPGRRPRLSNSRAVPSRPPPPKAPNSFWAPWPTKSSPTTRRRTSSARSIGDFLRRSRGVGSKSSSRILARATNSRKPGGWENRRDAPADQLARGATRLVGFMELVDWPGGRSYERAMLPGIADADGSGRCRLDAIARWLQDIAYADVVDAGFQGRGAWNLRRTRIRVQAFPRFGEALELRTFCSGIGRFSAERRTSIRGERGALEAVALWICLDPDRGRPLRFPPEFISIYEESAGGRDANVRLRHS